VDKVKEERCGDSEKVQFRKEILGGKIFPGKGEKDRISFDDRNKAIDRTMGMFCKEGLFFKESCDPDRIEQF